MTDERRSPCRTAAPRRRMAWCFASAAVITASAAAGVSARIVPTAAASADGPQSAARADVDLASFALTFSDGFDRFVSSPDGSRGWRTSLDWGDRTLPANHELQFYSDSSVGVDPFRASDGVLEIRAAPGANPLHLPYVSGAITTLGRFAQTYGYFEIRARLPAGEGFWPAFWLLPADHSWPPELDVFEQYGKDPRAIVVTSHSGLGGRHSFTYQNVPTQDVTADFHTYGVDWEPAETRWYVDHRFVFSAPTPADMDKPMYLIANLAVSAMPEPGHATGTFTIDHIRAYQRRDRISSQTPDPPPPRSR